MTKENNHEKLSDTAMILAAGFGTRLRPLTLEKPKPLFQVGGRAMLDIALDHLKKAGIGRVVVNAHYLSGQIATHLDARPDMELILSFEPEILDSGGGVKNARAQFGDKPFFVLNADLPWLDGAAPTLSRLADCWDDAKMDLLLLLYPTSRARGFGSGGDFALEPDGRAHRKGLAPPFPYVFISAMIVRPQLYDAISKRVFSNNEVFDLAEERERLYGLVHDGSCYQISCPEDLAEANRLLEAGAGWG